MRFLKMKYLLTLAFFTAAGVQPGHTSSITSDYTKIKLDACQLIQAPSEEDGTMGGAWLCEGYKGQPVYVAEGDLRMFVSFGANAINEPAATQTLPAFNTINETLEWRLRDGVPFATILRWFPSVGDGITTGSVLIVTQIQPGGGVCQVARVDARANKNANVLAREAADSLAGNFQCGTSPVVIGNPGILAY